MDRKLYKYPRTPHLPFSEGATSDDKILKDTVHLQNMTVVVTEKMDGENTSIYNDYFHARSLDSKHHSYHSWLARYVSTFSFDIPEGYRICGEYLYAKHSIYYDNLQSYFYGFSVWNQKECLNWSDTLEWFDLLGIVSVPQLYIGEYNDELIYNIAKETISRGGEGIVVRNTSNFMLNDFGENIAKFVRKNHVQTTKHWSLDKITANKLI